MPATDPMRLEVSPNIVEHLGLNLYTNLPRVLVEFVANAYDADSPRADIRADFAAVAEVRRELKAKWKARLLRGEIAEGETPLEEQTLPDSLTITIEDKGHGMSRADLQAKFLRIARKRRTEDRGRSPSGRIVMGRKGIGKLAGFGIAHRVEVISRAEGEPYATKITLDYENLIDKEKTEEVPIPAEILEDGGGLKPHGTRIALSRLVYEPMGSRSDTIADHIAEHFFFIGPEEFLICLNGVTIPPFRREYAYAYPEGVPLEEYQDKSLELEDGRVIKFSYRIRFTPKKKNLSAPERGIRVYAHKRLASLPDLLDLGTGMHGFQNTHYLDGVLIADFIDEQRSDYIASNRQTLRWDTPLLADLRTFLTDEMKQACIAYQDTKDATITQKVKSDLFTRGVIDDAGLPAHRKTTAFQIAAKLASGCGDETEDEYYKSTFPIIVDGLGYGQLLTTIATLAKSEHPSFSRVVAALADLTAAEWDDFARVVAARLTGIETLRKIYKETDFSLPDNEKELHGLLKKSPWLIDATFWKFLTSNVTEKTLSDKLSKELKVDKHVPKGVDLQKDTLGKNLRPDLVFLLSNYALGRIVIVELKAPNTPLHHEHLLQLQDYMRDVKEILKRMDATTAGLKVEGYLIGKRDDSGRKPREVERLEDAEAQAGVSAPWKVFDIWELLKRAEDAHRELLDVYERVAAEREV